MLPAGQLEAEICSASAEEYAAKIIKLQQACLTPLKEDLADWLNKIMSTSTITSDNFMDKLDNGVIICRLAKVISLWCEQQLAASDAQANQQPATTGEPLERKQQLQTRNNSSQPANTTSSQTKLNEQTHQHLTTQANSTSTSTTLKHQYLYFLPTTISNNTNNKLSVSTLNVHSTMTNISIADVGHCEPFHNWRIEQSAATFALATPLRHQEQRLGTSANGGYGSSKSSSQSTNCLTTSSSTRSNNGYLTRNQFLNNLIRMNQIKIWEDAKCRTFYARDNVCNFIKWSKEFGVNQSVLFESDDLVLHANTRQVVLCLLDVARIACVKHGFTEAPGLVKFEQEIDRELAAEKAAAIDHRVYNSTDGYLQQSQLGDTGVQTIALSTNKKLSSRTGNSRGGSIDATDDLIMRYCLHKEEEAARKKAAEIEADGPKVSGDEEKAVVEAAEANLASQVDIYSPTVSPDTANNESGIVNSDEDVQKQNFDSDSSNSTENKDHLVMKSPSDDLTTKTAHNKHNLTYDSRVDSLDSGEGQTESASTSHSRAHTNLPRKNGVSSIPTPIKRTNSSSSLTSHTSSVGSELSSSRSSLLSANDDNSKRHISSDLDGKVMKIAKSYYGKGATKGVTRLSEGKYKIADRIVFVRLLKGHRVMVRIGGGWDTLENFLFRHKSDPSQVIDVDNLLPLETKMTFEKSAHTTPTNNKFSKLPYYRRSSSASSTNLSVSNLSVHSPTSSCATSTTNNTTISTPNQTNSIEQPTQRQSSITKQQIPYLLIHRNQNSQRQAPQSDLYNNIKNRQQLKGPTNHPKTPPSYRYNGRPLGNSKTPAASATNLYPATLTTRSVSGNIKSMMNAKLNSTTNLHNGRTPKQEAFFKMNQSNDSLQASYYKPSPQKNRLHKQNGSSQSGNLNAKRSIDVDQRSTNGRVKQA